MANRTIRVLHVEDDPAQHRLIVHHLQGIREFDFDLRCLATEEEAIRAFESGDIDFVILDYHLSQGDGLHCLLELRRRDPIVPVLAISGMASPEIAANLVEAGADDYISKRDLTGDILGRSIRASLARVDAWNQRVARRPRVV